MIHCFFWTKYQYEVTTDQNPQSCRPGTYADGLQKLEASRSLNLSAPILPKAETIKIVEMISI